MSSGTLCAHMGWEACRQAGRRVPLAGECKGASVDCGAAAAAPGAATAAPASTHLWQGIAAHWAARAARRRKSPTRSAAAGAGSGVEEAEGLMHCCSKPAFQHQAAAAAAPIPPPASASSKNATTPPSPRNPCPNNPCPPNPCPRNPFSPNLCAPPHTYRVELQIGHRVQHGRIPRAPLRHRRLFLHPHQSVDGGGKGAGVTAQNGAALHPARCGAVGEGGRDV